MARNTRTLQSTYFGFNPPFIGGQQNVLSRQVDEQLIKNDLMQLLRTTPGERVHRPTFGTMVNSTMFNPLDSVMAMSLRQNIISQIQLWEPRVTVQTVTVTNSAQDDNAINIVVSVSPKYDPLTIYTVELTLVNQG